MSKTSSEAGSLVVVACCCLVLFIVGAGAAPGTPSAFRDIFIGRCEDYKLGGINKLADLSELSSKNCSELWELFSVAWLGKEPCDVEPNDYKDFVESASITIPKDMSNFWDGWDIYDTVRSYSREGQRTWTLDYTLIGYLINGFYFCGDGKGGVNTESCPDDGECGFAVGAVDAFWAEASKHFSISAEGLSRVFFNSSRPGGPFQTEESFFSEFELCNLTPEKISLMDIYVLTDVRQSPQHDCDSVSINNLKSILDSKSIPYNCWDNPRDVFHQLCIDYDDHEDCTFLNDDGAVHKQSFFLITCIAFIVLQFTTKDTS
ncbi:putative ADP-ribosyl cyclase isoform X1 [Apostichopus japonicus]|uniref:Putative ADP-ribosyl cyclase isoform X1 n=1 Tax=Stichopus japonicus TaxID=307972 RepID=A0A2G8KF45_STIJA|nr:putative ADP-ribosyl cyclase isoform X1 [Apostichopus japonicus]